MATALFPSLDLGALMRIVPLRGLSTIYVQCVGIIDCIKVAHCYTLVSLLSGQRNISQQISRRADKNATQECNQVSYLGNSVCGQDGCYFLKAEKIDNDHTFPIFPFVFQFLLDLLILIYFAWLLPYEG